MKSPFVLALVASLAAIPFASTARAADALGPEEDEDDGDATNTLWVRGNIGFGRGDVGIGGRAGVDSEYWMNMLLGVGVRGAALGQGQADGPGRSTQAFGAAPMILMRTPSTPVYFVLGMGLGYARVISKDSSACFATSCEVQTDRFGGGYWLLFLAMHAHEGPGEVGLVMQVESVPQSTLFTAGVSFGFGG